MKKILLLLSLIIAVGVLAPFVLQKINEKRNINIDEEQLSLENAEELFNPDSLDWEAATLQAPWQERDSHAVVAYKDKLWLMGGLNANDYVIKEGVVEYWKAPHFRDVWSSEDGKNWKLVTENAVWGERRSMQVVDFKGKMWLIGGWGPSIGYRGDI